MRMRTIKVLFLFTIIFAIGTTFLLFLAPKQETIDDTKPLPIEPTLPTSLDNFQEDLSSVSSFATVWDTRKTKLAMEMVALMDSAFQRRNVTYFATSSTLWGIGAMRKIVPWQQNLYFAYDSRVDLQEVVSDVHKMSFKLDIRDNYAEISKEGINIILTLIPFKITGNKVKIGDNVFSTLLVFPTARRALEGYMVKVPKKYKEFLNELYGEKWPYVCTNDDKQVLCQTLSKSFQYTFESQLERPGKIPKIIHQVWLGAMKLPPYELMEQCRDLHPDWEYHLWTDTNLPDTIEPRVAYDNMVRFNGKADILRWQLLKTYGGVWIDADTVCIKPVDEFLDEENDLFLGHHHWMNPNVDTKKEKNHGLLANSIVGSVPGHPIIVAMVEELVRRPQLIYRDNPWKTVGPAFVTKHFNKRYNDIGLRAAAYPFYYFVPYHWMEVAQIGVHNKQVEYDSFAVNTWGTTFKSYHASGQELDLFFIILSHENYKDRRDALRETWLTSIPKYKGKVGYAFFLGTPTSKNSSVALAEENVIYNDIIIMNMTDTFANLSLKVIESFSWVSNNLKADVIFKTDDDSFVNIQPFLDTIGPGPHKKYYMGSLWEGTKFNHVNTSKWYDPFFFEDSFWKNCKYYPTYASGAGYALSFDLVQWIVKSKNVLRQFHNEDAMVGIWMNSLDVTPKHTDKIIKLFEKKKKKKKGTDPYVCINDFILQHNMPPEYIRKYFKSWKETGQFCK